MYKPTELKTGLRTLVGFKQSLNPQQTQLNELTTSDSGLYFQSAHPLINIEVLKALAINSEPFTYDAFNIANAYVIGDIVSDSGLNYIRLTNGTGEALTDSAAWKPYILFEEVLKEWVDEAIIKTVNDWISRKNIMRTAANLLEREQLFRVRKFTSEPKTLTNFCGLKIRTLDSNGLKLKIHKVGLWFEDAGSITIKVFRSDKTTVVTSQACTITEGGSVQWFDLNLELDPKTVYYIGYYPSGNNYHEWIYNEEIRQNRFFDIHGFYRGQSGDPAAMWDNSNDVESVSQSYGVNLKISAYCDYTELILEQSALFAQSLSLRFAIDTLKKLVHNPQANVSRFIKTNDPNFLLYELQGNENDEQKSLIAEYNREIESIQFDKVKIDKACLPCAKKGVIYRAV